MKNENTIKEQPLKGFEPLVYQTGKYKVIKGSLKEGSLPCDGIEDRFRAVVETASDAIFTVSSDGSITSWNKAAEEIFGYTIEEILGKPYILLMPERYRKNSEHIRHQVFHAERANTIRKLSEYPGMRKDGSEFPAEISYSIYRTSDGFHLTGIVRDITGRREAEKALAQAYNKMEKRVAERTTELNAANEKLRQEIAERKHAEEEGLKARDFLMSTFNNALEGFIVSDPQGFITMANDAAVKMFGFSRNELIGKNTIELRPEGKEYEEKGREFIEKLFENGYVKGLERKWKRKDGTLIDLEINIVLLKDEEGTIQGSLGSLRDITQQKRAQEKLIAYNKQLRSLASELSLVEESTRRNIAQNLHDQIGQSLAIAKMKLGVLKKASLPGEITEAIDDIYHLIVQSTQDTRSLIFELRPPVLYELGFEAAIEWLIGHITKQHGITIDFEYNKHPKKLDNQISIFLFQAVRELLMNVVKHSGTHNSKVSIKKDDDYITITILDKGAGFDPSPCNSHEQKTTGFGLFSIKERLMYLGGDFDIQSQPGQGTAVTLIAPTNIDEPTIVEKMQ
jgi:PAS domain S-box-containing protein